MTEKQFFVWAGERYKKMREHEDVSQSEVSRITGIDRSIISKFENTGKKISTFRLKQLLEAIGYKLADFEPEEGESLPEKKTLNVSFTPGRLLPEAKKKLVHAFKTFIELTDEAIDIYAEEDEERKADIEAYRQSRSDAAAKQHHNGQQEGPEFNHT